MPTIGLPIQIPGICVTHAYITKATVNNEEIYIVRQRDHRPFKAMGMIQYGNGQVAVTDLESIPEERAEFIALLWPEQAKGWEPKEVVQ
jgi:hypothetical protein